MTLRTAARRVSQIYETKLEPVRLKVTQYAVLVAANELDGLSVNELAGHLDLDRTTIGKVLRQLQRSKLVKVVASYKDGRSRSITLTAKGAAALRAATPLWREAEREFEKATGKGNIASLQSSLTRIGADE
jgi:DNA-binding MarR family transcriptional regulator